MSEPIPNPLIAVNNAREDAWQRLLDEHMRRWALEQDRLAGIRAASRKQQQETTINNLRQELLATRRELLKESFKVARLTALLRETAGGDVLTGDVS